MYKKTKPQKKFGILFFVKYPIEGKVKSRLTKDLSLQLTTTLYRCFVTDLFSMLTKTSIPLLICYEPSDYKIHFQQWLGKNYTYLPQIGMTLGERLNNAFAQGFSQGYTHLLVIGSDSPDLTHTIIHTAFKQLDSFDTVIGPSSDGGYYLLALHHNTYSPKYFQEIQWSSPSVFIETLQRIKNEQHTIFTLPEWYDIDTFSDLKAFYHRNLTTSFNTSTTMQILIKYFKQEKNF
jgi:rSAM/selenodomain-associated transferase 1